MDDIFPATLQSYGIGVLHDPYGGDVRRSFASSHLGRSMRLTKTQVAGAWGCSSSLESNPERMRSYAANVYYLPQQHKSNLTVR